MGDILDSKEDELRKKVAELENDPNDIENKFHSQYPKFSDEKFDGDISHIEEVKVLIKRVYCPNCGKEIISKYPTMFNPFTGEKIGRYDCECGFKANLDYAYPRVIFMDKNGEEIKAFNE